MPDFFYQQYHFQVAQLLIFGGFSLIFCSIYDNAQFGAQLSRNTRDLFELQSGTAGDRRIGERFSTSVLLAKKVVVISCNCWENVCFFVCTVYYVYYMYICNINIYIYTHTSIYLYVILPRYFKTSIPKMAICTRRHRFKTIILGVPIR